MKTYFRIISIVLAFAFLSGCEKPQEGQSQGKDPDPIVNPDPLDPAARVVRVITEYTAGGHNVSDISYDSKGRMTKLTGGMFLGAEGVCNIEYNDASNTATAKFGDESMVMELDDSGRCINDGSWRYTYFGGHLVSSQSINGSSTWSYSWENDCLTDINYKTKATSGITYDTHDNLLAILHTPSQRPLKICLHYDTLIPLQYLQFSVHLPLTFVLLNSSYIS